MESSPPQPPVPEGQKGKPSRKKYYLWGGIGLGIAVLAIVAGFFVFGKSGTTITANTPKVADEAEEPQTLTAPRVIDGVMDLVERERLYPIGIMIENLTTIRPQPGLEYAHVVYEALAEGGITRFLGIYTLTGPFDKIGPVRSARPYYLDWTKEYGALYAHAGGSPEALSNIRQYEIFDLDQFFNAPYYWRSTDAKAPHNLFTSTKLMTFALRDKNAPKESTFTPWTFQAEAASSSRPENEQKITIDYSTFSYRVEWVYDRTANAYKRFHGDIPHTATNGNQHMAKDVIVQYVKTTLADAGRLRMETIGEGKAIVFRDGKAIEGRWKKASREGRTTFVDANGDGIPLVPGQIWVEIVPTDRTVQYTGKPAA